MAINSRPAAQPTRVRSFLTLSGQQALLGYLFVMPAVIVLLGLVAYPFICAVYISFTNRVVGDPGHWVGLANFRYLFHWVSFGRALLNTVTLVVVANLLKFVIGLGLALLLTERLKGRSMFRAFILLPWAMPGFVAFLTWRLLFSPIGGGINLLLQKLHLYSDIIDWLGQRSTAMPAVITATVWRGFPFWCISLLAALQNVPIEHYEAAKIDGASAWQRFLYVTLPSIQHTVLVVALLSSIWTANGFENIWIMTQGGPSDATITFPVLAFFGLQNQRLGEAAAVSVALVPIMAILVFFVANLLQEE